MNLPLRSNAYDDVTDFEICGFHKNRNLDTLRTKHNFFID